jgi:hypothetical protein
MTDTSPERAEAETWKALAQMKSEEALALMRTVVEFIRATEAGDDERLAGLVAGARALLREISSARVEDCAIFIEAGDPDWLDKLLGEED